MSSDNAGRAGVSARPDTLARALRQAPLRYLGSAWPWRAFAYQLTGLLLGPPLLLLLLGLLGVGLALTPVVIGLVVLALVLPGAALIGALERRRLRLVVGGVRPVSPHLPVHEPGPWRWLRARLSESASWRELGYSFLFGIPLALLDLVTLVLFLPGCLCLALPVAGVLLSDDVMVGDTSVATTARLVAGGLVLLVAGAYLAGLGAVCHAWLARLLLAPSDAYLARRLTELTRSRARIVDAFETERRRIERDLHDGAQQQLVALTMTLGLAELELSGVEGAGPHLVARARGEAGAALDSLRDLVRGIHPQLLTDRGIGAAVAEVADRSPLPVTVDIELPSRPPSAVESAAYFVVTEALTNVARHSGASRAEVVGRAGAGRLTLTVTDDGVGGADPGCGTGLTGLVDRLAVLDGTLSVDSPPGGPTVLRMEIPCPTNRCV